MAQYYTDQAGLGGAPSDSNAGALATPFLTIGKGCSVLHPGDTLDVRGATYTGTANQINDSFTTIRTGATAGNPIVIRAHGGGATSIGTYGPSPAAEVVVLQIPNPQNGVQLTGGQTYITVQDFVIDGGLASLDQFQALVYLNGNSSHNSFLRLEVKNSINFGIATSDHNGDAIDNYFAQCYVHDNGSLGGPATNGHGFYLGSSGNLTEYCLIVNNKGCGYQFNTSAAILAGNVLRKCVIAGGGRAGQTSFGVTVERCSGFQATDNLIYNRTIGTGSGMMAYSLSVSTFFANNTIYNMSGDGLVSQFIDASGGSGTWPVFRNNIVWTIGGVTIVNYGDGTTGSKTTWTVDHNFLTDPLFINPGTDFHLQATSTANGYGVFIGSVLDDLDGLTRPNPPSAGCYDSLGGTPLPPPTPPPVTPPATPPPTTPPPTTPGAVGPTGVTGRPVVIPGPTPPVGYGPPTPADGKSLQLVFQTVPLTYLPLGYLPADGLFLGVNYDVNDPFFSETLNTLIGLFAYPVPHHPEIQSVVSGGSGETPNSPNSVYVLALLKTSYWPQAAAGFWRFDGVTGAVISRMLTPTLDPSILYQSASLSRNGMLYWTNLYANQLIQFTLGREATDLPGDEPDNQVVPYSPDFFTATDTVLLSKFIGLASFGVFAIDETTGSVGAAGQPVGAFLNALGNVLQVYEFTSGLLSFSVTMPDAVVSIALADDSRAYVLLRNRIAILMDYTTGKVLGAVRIPPAIAARYLDSNTIKIAWDAIHQRLLVMEYQPDNHSTGTSTTIVKGYRMIPKPTRITTPIPLQVPREGRTISVLSQVVGDMNEGVGGYLVVASVAGSGTLIGAAITDHLGRAFSQVLCEGWNAFGSPDPPESPPASPPASPPGSPDSTPPSIGILYIQCAVNLYPDPPVPLSGTAVAIGVPSAPTPGVGTNISDSITDPNPWTPPGSGVNYHPNGAYAGWSGTPQAYETQQITAAYAYFNNPARADGLPSVNHPMTQADLSQWLGYIAQKPPWSPYYWNRITIVAGGPGNPIL